MLGIPIEALSGAEVSPAPACGVAPSSREPIGKTAVSKRLGASNQSDSIDTSSRHLTNCCLLANLRQPPNPTSFQLRPSPGCLKMANPHPIQRLVEEQPFHQKDAIKSGIQGALVGGGAGFLFSAVQNSLAKQSVGAWGVFTRTGGTIASLSTR